MVVLYITPAGMNAYLAANPLTVLRNEATVQAVTNNLIGVTEATLYAPASLTLRPILTLTQTTAGRGSSVLWQQAGDRITLFIADPEAWAGTMTFNVSERLCGVNAAWNPPAKPHCRSRCPPARWPGRRSRSRLRSSPRRRCSPRLPRARGCYADAPDRIVNELNCSRRASSVRRWAPR